MKKAAPLTLLLILSCVFFTHAQRTQECFEIHLGDFLGNPYLRDIVVDDKGYFILATTYAGNNEEIHLIRYDKTHTLLWRKNLGSFGYTTSSTLYKGAGNSVFYVYYSSVYKYSETGLQLKFDIRNFHNVDVLHEDASGNIFAAGISFFGEFKRVISSYSSTGANRWLKEVPAGSNSNVSVRDIRVLPDGSVIFAGETNQLQLNYGKITPDGNVATNLKIDALTYRVRFNSMAIAQDGIYLFATQEHSNGTSDAYLYKTDVNGTLVRSTKLTTLYTGNYANAVTVVDNVNPIVSYYSTSATLSRGSVTKFTSTGTTSWSYNVSNDNWYPQNIQTDNAGNLYVKTDFSITKLTAGGVLTDQLAAASSIQAYSIAPIGDIYILDNYAPDTCGLTTLKNCSPLTVTTNISNKVVCTGATTELQFVVSGKSLTYQWKKNGVNIFDDEKVTGSKTAKITIKNMNGNDIGDYTCVTIDNCGKTLTSAIAKLSLPTALTISTHPVSKLICAATNTTLTVAATGGTNIKYQWTKNGVNMNDGGNVSGTKTATLTLNGITAADAASYACSVNNDCNVAVVSGSAAITVGPGVQVTRQPSAQSAAPGNEAVFSIEASGGALTYQWKKNNVNIANDAKFAGVTTPFLTVKNIACADAANFSCTVTGTCGAPVNTTAVALAVTSNITIIQEPVAQKICSGSSAVMVVQAAGSSLTYSWIKGTTVLADGGKYAGTKTSVLTVSNVAASETGSYTCVVSGGCASTKTSAAATIEIVTAPSFTSQSQDKTICDGETTQLTVGLSTGNYTYQWLKNGVALSNSSTISGVTSASLFILNGSSGDAGSYSCRATGCGGQSTTSAAIVVTVTSKVIIQTQPAAKSFCEGSEVSLTIAASGTTTTYQWLKSGIPLADNDHTSGATTNKLTISDANIGLHEGFYSCRVQGCGVPITSSVVQVIGNAKPDLFLAAALECFEFTEGIEAELIGDNAELAGTLKVFRENSTTPLPGFHAIAQPGVYQIVKTTGANCSNTLTITLDCVVTGLEEGALAFSISPNPSNGKILLSSADKFNHYEIVDLVGKSILNGDVTRQEQQIDLGEISNGLYLFVIHNNNGQKKTQKIIVNK